MPSLTDNGAGWFGPVTRGKGQALAPVTGAVADVDNRRRVSVNNDNHNHIEEVINDNNEHPEFPAITGR